MNIGLRVGLGMSIESITVKEIIVGEEFREGDEEDKCVEALRCTIEACQRE